MGRKTETILTFKVKVKLPTGSNAHAMQLYIREVLEKHSDIERENFTVSLLKKEVIYA
jgi:hypothetical protein